MPALFDRWGRWVAAAAGALLPLSFAPLGLWYLAPPLLAALFLTWVDQLPREAAVRGFLFGFALFAAGTWWLFISIHVFGQAPQWLAALLMLALFAILAVYPAMAGLIAASATSMPAWARWCLYWPATWIAIEWLRGWLFTGFPWLSVGYAQTDGWLTGWAPIAGVYGLGLIVAVLAGVLVTLAVGARRDRVAAIAIGAVLIAASLALHERDWTRQSGPALAVSLVQGAITQDRKWLPEQREPTMRMYRDLTLGLRDPDIVVWPEAAIPALDVQVGDYLDAMHEDAAARGYHLLLGILGYDRESGRYANTLIALGDGRESYEKRHLVPFGEFFPVPDFIREWLRLMNLPYNDAIAGPRDQPPLTVGNVALAPSICYEDAFGTEQLDFLPAAGLLVNVSNDAWFGDSIAPHQHLQIARMRALETGRYMLRATNTGITAIIGPRGRVRDRLPQFETGVLSGRVTARTGSTPYIRAGNFPVVFLVIVVAVLGLLPLRR